MTNIAASFCSLLLLPQQHEWTACRAFMPPPTIEQACWSVTNYWPFDERGQLQAWNGQADGDPYHTANGTEVTIDKAWRMAAGPLPIVGQTLVFPDGRRLAVTDTFGHPEYQAGVFWHDSYEEWVIGVDVFTPEPLHYLECGGEIR